jgi:hypothetical protein
MLEFVNHDQAIWVFMSCHVVYNERIRARRRFLLNDGGFKLGKVVSEREDCA